ncbi:MAG: HEAT repeat domain-containing protein [Planctomycetota bacterium]|jgi:HEAT repeat protein
MIGHNTFRPACLAFLSIVVFLAGWGFAEESPSAIAAPAFDPTAPAVVSDVADVVSCGDMARVWPIQGLLVRLPGVYEKVIDELIARLADEGIDPERRRYAAIGLATINQSAQPALDSLIAALSSEHYHVRRGAAEAIGRLKWGLFGWPEADVTAAVSALAWRAGDAEDTHLIRLAAVNALRAFRHRASPSVPVLLDLVRGDNWELAGAAVTTLARIGANTPEVTDVLLERLPSVPEAMRIRIVSILVYSGADADPALLAAAIRPLLLSDGNEIRRPLRGFLEGSPPIEALVDDLIGLLGQDNLKARALAVEVLTEWKVTPLPAETVDLLADYLLEIPEAPVADEADVDDPDGGFFGDGDFIGDGDAFLAEEDGWIPDGPWFLVDMIRDQGGSRASPTLQRIYDSAGPELRLSVISALFDPMDPDAGFFTNDPMDDLDGRLLMQALSDPYDLARHMAALGLLHRAMLPDEHVATVADGMDTYFFGYEAVLPERWPDYGEQGLKALHLALTGHEPDGPLYKLDATLRFIQCMGATPLDVLPDIIALLDHPFMDIRWRAAYVLMKGDSLPPAAVEPLCAFLASSAGPADFSEGRQWAALASKLLQAGQAEMVTPVLADRLGQASLRWQVAALAVLGGQAGEDEPEQLTELRERAEAVLREFSSFGDDGARRAVLDALPQMAPTEPVIDLVLEAMADPDPQVSRHAVNATWHVAPAGADRIVPALLEIVQGDGPAFLHEAAIRALGGFGASAEQALPALLQIALAPDDAHAREGAYAWVNIHSAVTEATNE